MPKFFIPKFVAAYCSKTVKEAVTALLNELILTDYKGCFQLWEQRWNQCVELEGDYCEGR